MSSSELIKFLRDFQVSPIQMSKEDLVVYMRLINIDILKKVKGKDSQASLQIFDFEGFVEFIL